jgi:hypothetical protein
VVAQAFGLDKGSIHIHCAQEMLEAMQAIEPRPERWADILREMAK